MAEARGLLRNWGLELVRLHASSILEALLVRRAGVGQGKRRGHLDDDFLFARSVVDRQLGSLSQLFIQQ